MGAWARPPRRRPPSGAAHSATPSIAVGTAALLLLRAALLCGAARVAGGASAAVAGTGAGAWRWATPAQEAEDERHDADILRAVVRSMDEWGRRAAARHRDHAHLSPNATVSHRRAARAAGVCYPEVGCFSDSGVFGYLDMLPSPPDEVGTRFQVFAAGGAEGGGGGGAAGPLLDVPFANRSAILTLGGAFDPSKPTKVIVHGFGSSCSHVWVYEMRSALMAVEECNVICVDWENGAAVPNYVRAAANTRLVGKQLALLLRALGAARGLLPRNVHLIGFSLGAHVAGFAGAELRNLSRITGLDPAGPLFEGQDPRARLDATDADFVDVIHSNGENLILGGLGSWQPMGHVDFYPNGGRMQKGCSHLFVGAFTDILWSASELEGRSLCNHRRAYKFFTDSVSPRCHFPAFPCASYEAFLEGSCFPCTAERRCGNMGYYADRAGGRGVLFLVTRDEEPFCAHQYSVRLESASAEAEGGGGGREGRSEAGAGEGPSSYGSVQLTLSGAVGVDDAAAAAAAAAVAALNETFALTRKDDEQLRPGRALARLLVPHPALAAPQRATLLYTAYAGWWSSGLPAWPVRKLSVMDSFGKSMSVCRRDVLMLQSGVPVTLQLFPGECHPPAAPAPAASALASAPGAPLEGNATAPSALSPPSESEDKTSATGAGDGTSEAAGEGAPEDSLTTLLAGAAPLLDGGGGNSLEDSRAFHSGPASEVAPAPAPSASTTPSPSHPPAPGAADPSAPPQLPDIKEPVLTPRRSALAQAASDKSDDGDAEDGPGRAARLAGRFTSEAETRLWIPAAELNPPPLGGPGAWRHWTLATAPGASAPPPPPPTADAPRAPRTLQFLPQRLAALLSQAERFARRALGREEPPLAHPPPSVLPPDRERDLPGDGEAASGPRRSKAFGAPADGPALAAPSATPASASPPPPPPDSEPTTEGLVALARGAAELDPRRFIPLAFPAAPRPRVTVAPDALRSSFRSVRVLPAGSTPAPAPEDERRPVYTPPQRPGPRRRRRRRRR